MSHISDLTKKYYSSNVDAEWERLFKSAFNRLEYDTTWRIMDQYLPQEGLVLDAGG